MKVIRQYEFGGPDRLRFEEAADPWPGVGQVRIAVEASGVHLIDTTIRSGTSFGASPPPDLPMIPGREVAGTIEATGPGVDPAWAGRRVVAHLGTSNGGYASLAIAGVEDALAVPDHVEAASAVAMVGTGRTTLAILDVADIQADDVVLVTGAAGGIGTLLIQAAKAAGATVVGVAGGQQKVAVVERLGADAAIDYSESTNPWPDRVRAALREEKITLALDGVGGDIARKALELVEPGGRLVIFGNASGTMMPLSAGDLFSSGVTVAAAIGARLATRPGGIRPLSERALDEAAAGRLLPTIHPPFPLAGAAEAHRAVESRTTIGKVILTP